MTDERWYRETVIARVVVSMNTTATNQSEPRRTASHSLTGVPAFVSLLGSLNGRRLKKFSVACSSADGFLFCVDNQASNFALFFGAIDAVNDEVDYNGQQVIQTPLSGFLATLVFQMGLDTLPALGPSNYEVAMTLTVDYYQ